MLHRRARSHSPENARQLEAPNISWRNVSGQLATLQHNVDNVQARLGHYGGLITAHKGKLEGDEDSLSIAKVCRIAKQFRADTRQYTAALEDVLDVLEQSDIAMSTALHQADALQEAVTNSEEEMPERVRLSRLVVEHWMWFRQPQPGTLRPSRSLESSSSHSDMGSGIAPQKRRKIWFKPMRMVTPDPKATEDDADVESGAVTEDQEGPVGLTEENRGVTDGRTSSSGDGGQGVSSRPVGRSSSEDGGAEEASSGAAAGSDAGGDEGIACEEVEADQGSGDQATQSEASVTQYRSAASVSFQSFHSANSGDEADCEPEMTTTPAGCTTSDSNNGNGSDNGNSDRYGNDNGNELDGGINANGKTNADVNNGNAINNAEVSMQSTASQTDESWIAWDSVKVGDVNKQSAGSVLQEVCRQQVLVRRAVQRHAERLAALRLGRLHLLSQEHPLRASRLLRAQLQDTLRNVGSEVRAAQHSLRMRASALRLLDDSERRSQPPQSLQRPQPLSTTHEEQPQQSNTSQQDPQPPQYKTTHQELLAEAAAISTRATEGRRPPLAEAVNRTVDFFRRLTTRD